MPTSAPWITRPSTDASRATTGAAKPVSRTRAGRPRLADKPKSRGRASEFGVGSPGAWAVALLPALPVGVALLSGDVVWLWSALACVLAPYYAVIQGVRERRSDEKHEAAGEAAASDPN